MFVAVPVSLSGFIFFLYGAASNRQYEGFFSRKSFAFFLVSVLVISIIWGGILGVTFGKPTGKCLTEAELRANGEYRVLSVLQAGPDEVNMFILDNDTVKCAELPRGGFRNTTIPSNPNRLKIVTTKGFKYYELSVVEEK